MAIPDTRACWPVAASAAVFVFFGMMLIKSESVMYVGFMDMFQVHREEASWPLTVAVIMSQLSGPLYGLLGLWLSDRVLLIVGALLCALPVMACALAQSLGLVVFLYGVLFGVGVACEELVPFTVVARHFIRYRGTAMGLLFAVTGVSGFVSPLIVEALRQAFDFRTALLILGSLELNMLFGCVFVNRVPHNQGDCEAPPEPAIEGRPRASSFHTASLAKYCSKDLVSSLPVPRSPASKRTAEVEPLLRRKESVPGKIARSLHSLASLPFLHVAASRAVCVFVLSSFLLTAVDFGSDNGLDGWKGASLLSHAPGTGVDSPLGCALQA
ncbi:hypothetical protein HPB50_006538 [Hyalomma asiaticum]|uniref:Uncharacterized protein n=1 Tax=Hyalomma asiaticum TaxID=266040 RepID=A0ACB7SW52_HYAAI|nr:hypothetical protein HPB50_006538 [Hyalomma asiaticum]